MEKGDSEPLEEIMVVDRRVANTRPAGTSASLAWIPSDGRGFGLALAVDNLSDDDFEPFPGTPAVGQQISLSARYDW